MSRSTLHRLAHDGRLERIARGIYLPVDTASGHWEWIEAASRRPEATICLTSALALHDLTDEIPTELNVAIHREARIPAGTSAIRWHRFNTATFDLGRDEIPIPDTDQTIALYSPERSIVDAFRTRGTLGYELPLEALKEWLRRGGKPTGLVTLAKQIPRSQGPLLAALETLT